MNFATLEDADTFVDGYILDNEEWNAASDQVKIKHLSAATIAINSLNFVGDKTDENQALAFPRGGANEIPPAIVQATIYEAVALLSGRRPEKQFEDLTVDSDGFSTVRTTYNRTTVQEMASAGIVSFQAWNLLRPFVHSNRELRISRV